MSRPRNQRRDHQCSALSATAVWRDGPEVVVANPATDNLQFSVWDDDTPAPIPGSEPEGAGGIFELEVNVREAR